MSPHDGEHSSTQGRRKLWPDGEDFGQLLKRFRLLGQSLGQCDAGTLDFTGYFIRFDSWRAHSFGKMRAAQSIINQLSFGL
jgi:hypothetical protein